MRFRRFLLLCLYTTLLRWGMIFCVYIKTNFFPLPQEVTTIFLVIPLQLCHLNHQRMRLVWRQMHCYFHFFFFYLAMQEEALCQVRILPLLWGHLVLFPLLILWITLNIKICWWRVAVVDICWYWWFVLWRNASRFIALKAIDASTINTASALSLLNI